MFRWSKRLLARFTANGREASTVRKLGGESGILFSFRGPVGGNKGKFSTARWSLFTLEINGRKPRDRMFTPTSRMYWVELYSGTYRVEFLTIKGESLWSADVQVLAGPATVAVWPETQGLRERSARVVVDGVVVPSLSPD